VVADADTTLLEAIRGAGIDIESDCEEGYCGTCETRVLEGTPDHRDVVLSKAERAAGKTFFPCVSRACGLKLVLDL
jgi:ferredoxin